MFIALVYGIFVQLLWNYLMPPIFHSQEITYWQATGLVVLTRLLVGSLGYHGTSRYNCHRNYNCPKKDNQELKTERAGEKESFLTEHKIYLIGTGFLLFSIGFVCRVCDALSLSKCRDKPYFTTHLDKLDERCPKYFRTIIKNKNLMEY